MEDTTADDSTVLKLYYCNGVGSCVSWIRRVQNRGHCQVAVNKEIIFSY